MNTDVSYRNQYSKIFTMQKTDILTLVKFNSKTNVEYKWKSNVCLFHLNAIKDDTAMRTWLNRPTYTFYVNLARGFVTLDFA